MIGGGAVGAIGYQNLTNVFPYGGPDWALGMVLGGGVAMTVVLIWMIKRFYQASRVVYTSSDRLHMNEADRLTCEERLLLNGLYQREARKRGAGDLESFEDKGQELARAADGSEDEKEALKLRKQSLRILTQVSAVHMRAAYLILRRRVTTAGYGKLSIVLYAVFALGWFSMAFGSDWLESERTDAIAVAESCAEARETAGIDEALLPDICGDPPEAAEATTGGA